MSGEETPDHRLVERTDSYPVYRHPVGKMGDRSPVRKNRGLAVSLVKQMSNEPVRMGLQLACTYPGRNVNFVRQKTAGHDGSPLWRRTPGEEHRELCAASLAVRLPVRLQIKTLRLEIDPEPHIILNRT